MLFNVIASGSKGNATIVKYKKTVILIDMGISFSRLKEGLEEIHVDFEDIDAAIFTHDHADHIAGLRFIPTKKQYALENGIPGTFNTVKLFEPFYINDIKITPIPTSHDATNPCGYILETDKEKMVYMTDTGYIPDASMAYCKDATYVILESNYDLGMLMRSGRPHDLIVRIHGDDGHLCNEDSALYCSQMVSNNTKEVILAHISEECNTPEVALDAYKRVFEYRGLDINKYHVRVANQWHSTIGGSDED